MIKHKKHKFGLLSAVMLGISSIIGSGWLFAPYKSAYVAGPASLYAWCLGAIVVILLAMCFAEIASLHPKRGLTAIIPTISHNKFFGFPFAIANWLGIVAVIALEADATIQYLINLFPGVKEYFFRNEHLTVAGNSLSLVLVLFYCLMNFWGAKLLAKTNNIFTILKVIVPIFTALIIISVAFHTENFTIVGHSMVPYGYKSIFTAILTTGIVIAFNGFQTVIAFASEIEKPHRNIPLSLIIAVIFCLGVYLLLEVAFIGGMPTKMLANGWQRLEFNAPMVQLASLLGLGLLTSIIYFGATIAPSGTAVAFTGTATRMFTAMSRNQQMPMFFDDVHPIYGVSRRSLAMNAALAVLFLFCFRSWGQLAQVLSLFHVISYLPIPLALWVFRDSVAKQSYQFRLPFGKIIALALFIFFTYLFTMGDTRTVMDIVAIFALLQGVFIWLNVKSKDELLQALKQCYLLMLYFIGLLVLVHYSPSHYAVSEKLFIPVVVLFSLVSFFSLIRFERNDPDFDLELETGSPH